MRVNAVGGLHGAFCAVQIPQKPAKNRENLGFYGYKIHLIDGGLHADTMKHFARAIGEDIGAYTKFSFHEVGLLAGNPGLKDLSALDKELTRLTNENILKPDDFVAIPITAPIELGSLSYYYRKVKGGSEHFTPENIKDKKGKVLEFLETVSDYTMREMDEDKQGFGHVANIIKTVNKLVKKGVHVYIPADHPLENAIKWRAGEQGIKDSLYRYISAGTDEGGKINKIINELKEENAYKFNLLTLSDARIVNLQNRAESGNYIFSAFDSCVTDRARGVFNFCPVRDDKGKILGYSFTDKTTVQYPYDEYLGNEHIAEISHFVGKKLTDFSYAGDVIGRMRLAIAQGIRHSDFPNVPYPIREIYPPDKIAREKLATKGQFVDRTGTLFFDLNRSQELIFRRCDCEGTERPSVVSMWGSCFATINLMTKNVRNKLNKLFSVKLPKLMKLARQCEEEGCLPEAESILKKALALSRPEDGSVGRKQIENEIAKQLEALYARQGRVDDVEKLLQESIPSGYSDKQEMIRFKVEELKRKLHEDNA